MSLKKLFLVYIGWRLMLFIFLFFAISTVTLQMNFLGGGLSSYLHKPYLWSWLNFDGEHFISIARQGYQPLTYFYFPAYPLLVRFLTRIVGESFNGYAKTGLFVSNISFLIGIIGLIRLIRLERSCINYYYSNISFPDFFLFS